MALILTCSYDYYVEVFRTTHRALTPSPHSRNCRIKEDARSLKDSAIYRLVYHQHIALLGKGSCGDVVPTRPES